jgi:hypothetical protein
MACSRPPLQLEQPAAPACREQVEEGNSFVVAQLVGLEVVKGVLERLHGRLGDLVLIRGHPTECQQPLDFLTHRHCAEMIVRVPSRRHPLGMPAPGAACPSGTCSVSLGAGDRGRSEATSAASFWDSLPIPRCRSVRLRAGGSLSFWRVVPCGGGDCRWPDTGGSAGVGPAVVAANEHGTRLRGGGASASHDWGE